MIIFMNEIDRLKESLGTYAEVAKALGISQRHLRYIRSTGRISSPLRKLITFLLRSNEYHGMRRSSESNNSINKGFYGKIAEDE